MTVKDALNIWGKIKDTSPRPRWQQLFTEGKFTKSHYAGFLRETYFQAGMNPQLQAFTTMFIKKRLYNVYSMFFEHARSELKHDLLALDDLKNLGIDVSGIENEFPLPETEGFSSFVIKQIMFDDPVCYLGYLFHLEFTPTQDGPSYINYLKKIGVEEASLTFLDEHATVDIGHNNLMEKYLRILIDTPEKEKLFNYSLECAIRLHDLMMDAAVLNGESKFKF